MLFDFDFGAGSLELLLDLFGFFFLGTFLEGLGCALNELLGLSQAQTWNHATHFLNDGDFVAASISQDHVELSLFLSRSSSGTSRASCGDSHRSRGAYAPLLFEGFDKVSHFQNGQPAQVFYDFCNISHVFIFGIAVSWSTR
jgi:hypothetical protein